MSPKGPHCWTLCLLLLGMAAFLMPPCEGRGYDSFVKRHLDNPKSVFSNDNSYCTQMMQRKGLICQRGNTFIHAPEGQVKAICTARGNMLQGNVVSKTMFPITICKRRRFHRVVCRYKGKSKIRKIRVTCDKGLPVHYINSV